MLVRFYMYILVCCTCFLCINFDAITQTLLSHCQKFFKVMSLENKLGDFTECNYAKGRWVADNRRPLYSGTKCKQWLSDMWSCRLTLRTDFSYEAYRWQPEACDMPEFNGSQFLRRCT